MHASLGISGTISANIEEECDIKHVNCRIRWKWTGWPNLFRFQLQLWLANAIKMGNRNKQQQHSLFSQASWGRPRWEIGPQKNRLANQNKGLAISSVGSNIWHGGGSAIIGCGALTPSMFLAALQVSWRAVSKK